MRKTQQTAAGTGEGHKIDMEEIAQNTWSSGKYYENLE